MRILSASLVTLSFLALPMAASAHDIEKKKTGLSEFKLPTQAEMEQIIDDMPDFNGLMDGMLKIAQDEDIRSSLERAGETLSEKMETLSDMEMRENGLPDMNKMMATMLRTFSDEDFMGEMMDVVTELQEAVEENFDEELREFAPELKE